MKWNFAMMKSVIQLIFVLWCGVVTNAQDNEPLRKNATSIVRPSRATVVGTMNATVMSTPTFHSTTEPLQEKNATSFVRPNRTAVVGTMNDTVMSTPTFHPTTERIGVSLKSSTSGSYFLLKIIVGFVGAVALLIVVGIMVLLYKITNQKIPHQGDDSGYYKLPRLGDNVVYAPSAEQNIRFETDSPFNINANKVIKDAVSMRPDVVTKLIPADGGVIDIDDIIFKIGPGCLTKNTEITLIKHRDRAFAIKSLLDLGLVVAAPRVVEFLPDGLKFLKPADLTIRFENIVSDSEPFILHSSYRHNFERTVWELVTNGIEVDGVEGVVNAKLNGFCFYSLILATRGMLARILSHLNYSFACRVYALYRRIPTMDTLDISVVILSEFVDDDKGEDIKQLKDHLDLGFVKGEKGLLKRVHTDRRLKMSLHFPGVENTPFSFIVDQPELDSVGFVIDHFKGIAVKCPASGIVKISEVDRSDEDQEDEVLWQLNVIEMQEKIKVEVADVQNTSPEVVYRTTKLTNGEITRMSRMVGVDWDNLAGLMDIPYSEREEIRANYGKYQSFSSKAEHIFKLFNDSKSYSRHILEKCFDELGRRDLKTEMLPVENENGSAEVETSPTPPVIIEEDLLHTPLSPREISRLGRRIVVEWDHLAGLMDIARAERDDIRYSLIYNGNRPRAEKILTIFNNKEDFSREKLARCLEEIQQLDLIKPVITGEWRNL